MADLDTLDPKTAELTLSSVQALAALADFCDRGAELPTGEALAAAIGRNDPSSARRTMRKLEERNLFTRAPFAITPAGRALLDRNGGAAPPPQRPAVRHGDISRFPFNPRSTFDETAVAELAQSIKASGGLIQPILIRPDPDRPGFYQGIAGERRYRAIGMLIGEAAEGWTIDTELFVEIRSVDDFTAQALAITENADREDVHELDECRSTAAMVKMRVEEGLKHADALRETASKLGTVKRTVEIACQIVRDCAPEVLAAWGRGDITSKRHCLALSRAPQADQRAVLARIVKGEDGYQTEAQISARVAEIEEVRNAPDLFDLGGEYTKAETWRALFGGHLQLARTSLVDFIKSKTSRHELAIETGAKAGHIAIEGPNFVRLIAKPGASAFKTPDAWDEAFSITEGKMGRKVLEERIAAAADAAGCRPTEAILAAVESGALIDNGHGWFERAKARVAPIVSSLATFDPEAERPRLSHNEHGVYPDQDQILVTAGPSRSHIEIALCHCDDGSHRYAVSISLPAGGHSTGIFLNARRRETRAEAYDAAKAEALTDVAKRASAWTETSVSAEATRRDLTALWKALGGDGPLAFPNPRTSRASGGTASLREQDRAAAEAESAEVGAMIDALDKGAPQTDPLVDENGNIKPRSGGAVAATFATPEERRQAYADQLAEHARAVADMLALKRLSIRGLVAAVGPREHRDEVRAAVESLFNAIATHPDAARDHGEHCVVETGGTMILIKGGDGAPLGKADKANEEG